MINHKLPIFVIDNSSDYTGAFKAIFSTSVALSEDFTFIFFLPKKSTVIPLVEGENIPVITLQSIELSRRFLDILLYLPALFWNGFRLSRLAADRGAKIIHVNDFYNLSGTVAKLFLPSIKLITHIRKMPDSFPSGLSRIWLEIHKRSSDQIIAVSRAVMKQLPRGYPAKLVYDGIQKKEEYPRKNFSSKRDEIKLLYLGHFIPGKGQDYALEAFRDSCRNLKNICLTFIGGDMGLKKNRKYRESLEEKAKEWGIAELVEFRKYSSDPEKEIKEADIVLNFSESESFSFTCLEALYYGTALIATDSGGPPELFEHGKTGYLVKNRDIQSMKNAINYLVTNASVRNKYALEARQNVIKNFDFQDTIQKLKWTYEQMLCNVLGKTE